MKPQYEGNNVDIYEWPNPMCELRDKDKGVCVTVRTKEDAESIVNSLREMIYIMDNYKK